ncbi:unnamed protein product [Cylicocyclus nassatus]|uniref:Uncharacterized protein n=1 Tax=Cylicocyclus nassatus TaxID=53992 RepID=A0AA36MAY6_CYLNA|nr:unnamed protein product [Cylicocyclus nassatus]
MLPILTLLFNLKLASAGKGPLRCPFDFLCHHDGICDTNGSCICEPSWTGDMCELEATPCPMRPCVNGNCQLDAKGEKFCQCDHRFEGKYCELDKDECAFKVCPADAECLNHMPRHDKDRGYSCICPTGYVGEQCEIEVDLCELYKKKGDNYCHNGGECEARHVCMCQDGFGGARCSHRVPLRHEYEEFGCPERPEVCAKLFDDGRCDEICNRESCLFDGFDCAERNGIACRNPVDCAYKYGDGKCDEECAGAECGYDGGDCEQSKSTAGTDENMIGVAVGVPPDVAVKNLRQLQAELAQRLYTHVSIAEDNEGFMVYEWSVDGGQGNRISVIDEQLIASTLNDSANGTMVFFAVDTLGCRLLLRRNHSKHQCFTDLRPATTYLTLELARTRQASTQTLPIRDITWRKKRSEVGLAPSLTSPTTLIVICIVAGVLSCIACTGVIVVIIRVRKRRRRTVFAPFWRIPGQILRQKSGELLSESIYCPPTPPENNSPGNGNNELRKDADMVMEPVVDEDSPLLHAVRRGDHQLVQQMIQSAEKFVDVNGLGLLHHAVANNDAKMLSILVDSGQLDLFQRNSAGQSPLLYAAKSAHADLECISILVKAIDKVRKKRYDDIFSGNVDDVEANRYFRRNLLKMFPLYDEAEVMYSLTDAMGRNVVHYAALYNAPHHINYFASCGANMNLIDTQGDAPIHLAARNGNFEAIVALIRCNCDVNIKDGSDRTAYEVAKMQGHLTVCRVFQIAHLPNGSHPLAHNNQP